MMKKITHSAVIFYLHYLHHYFYWWKIFFIMINKKTNKHEKLINYSSVMTYSKALCLLHIMNFYSHR